MRSSGRQRSCLKASAFHSDHLYRFPISTKPFALADRLISRMEKPVKWRNKILAFLPKVASAVTFHISPPISPAGKGSSAPNPIVSLIPKEAPRKSKNGSFEAREPASPRVSCMGQIQCKKKKKETVSKRKLASQAFPEEVKRKPSMILKLSKETKRGHKSDVSNEAKVVAERTLSLRQMKQFSCARGTLPGFDWRTYDAAGSVSNPLYEGKGVKGEKEDKVVVNGVGIAEETRKENLWKRRITARLTPIQL